MSDSILDRIKILCAGEGITVTDLEQIIGIGRGVIYHWTDGSNPSTSKIAAIADHFDVSVDWILGRTAKPKADAQADFDLMTIQRAREKMTPEQRADMMTMLRIGFKEAFRDK